jgi:hypothetical protein
MNAIPAHNRHPRWVERLEELESICAVCWHLSRSHVPDDGPQFVRCRHCDCTAGIDVLLFPSIIPVEVEDWPDAMHWWAS